MAENKCQLPALKLLPFLRYTDLASPFNLRIFIRRTPSLNQDLKLFWINAEFFNTFINKYFMWHVKNFFLKICPALPIRLNTKMFLEICCPAGGSPKDKAFSLGSGHIAEEPRRQPRPPPLSLLSPVLVPAADKWQPKLMPCEWPSWASLSAPGKADVPGCSKGSAF